MSTSPVRYTAGIERDGIEVSVIIELGRANVYDDADEALEVAARRAQQAAAETRDSIARARGKAPF